LKLFGVLQQADPALVDPGVTAQLECLLDDVVVGKQEMVGAIDAVCDVAQRIIGKLLEGPPGGVSLSLGFASDGAGGGRPPTTAMKRFADGLARQKGIKPPAGYTKSGSVCRAFLEKHAPKKAEGVEGKTMGGAGVRPVSPAQLKFAERISLEKGVAITDEAKVDSATMSVWIDKNQSAKPGNGRRKAGAKNSKPPAAITTKATKQARKPKATTALVDATSPSAPEQRDATANTSLRIPYGNKDVAQKLGARYAAGGWYAPPGVDLTDFKLKGWI
jgi:DNA topoisomerase-3